MNKNHTITSRLLLAACCLVMLHGCNWSNEDLIFLEALPNKENVAIKVPGQNNSQSLRAGGQALSCNTDNLHCMALNLSNGINAGVFLLLDLVDALAHNHQPTTRQENLRIWGPHYILESNLSIRFEMERKTSGSSEKFAYCLHVKPGGYEADQVGDMSCSGAEDSGFFKVLYGEFQPNRDEGEGGARYGKGTLVFDLNTSRDNGLGEEGDEGVFSLIYDNTASQVSIQLHIAEVTDHNTLLSTEADYCYHRNENGSGDFQFIFRTDFVGGLFPELEEFTVEAQWTEENTGRADAFVSGGNLGTDEVTITQCWDEQLDSVYYQDSIEENPTTGDASYCPTFDTVPDQCG